MAEHPITDEQLGNAIRRISAVCSMSWNEDTFQYYARSIVHMADRMEVEEASTYHVQRIRITVDPPARIDGLVEHLLEMVTDMPATCGPWPVSVLTDPPDW